MLTFSSYDADADCLLERLNWRKLESQRKLHSAVTMYKSLNGLAPDYMRSMFTKREEVGSYSLRDTEGKLAIPKPRTNYLKDSFSYKGAVLWNSLPVGLRRARTLHNFRGACLNTF